MPRVCGIDLGSRSVKIAVLEAAVLGARPGVTMLESLDTITFYREYGRKREGRLAVDFKALGLPEVDKLITTGYGRNTLEVAGGETIPELKAHVKGVLYQTGLKDFTLVDLGGQDSKIIRVKNGRMMDFMTNDKCAASSGRYLENMASILGIPLEELGWHSANPVELSSTCAVFGESELIGKIVEGFPLPEMAAGVNAAIVKRILPLLRTQLSEVIVFTGGVAHNGAVQKLLLEGTGREILVPQEPQFNGAIGCAVYGFEEMEETME